jgi:opacity protein-like surface antigen
MVIALFTAAITWLYAPAARAQATQPQAVGGPVEPGHWTVSPYVQFPFAGNLEGAATGLGIAGGYNWNSRIGLEADFSVVPTVTEGVLVNFDATTWNLTGNVLYHFRAQRERWTPFVVAGLGIGHGSTDLVADDPLLRQFGANDSTTGLVTNLGGGVKYYLNDRFGLRGDLRYYTGHDLIPDHVRLSFGLGIDLGTRVP